VLLEDSGVNQTHTQGLEETQYQDAIGTPVQQFQEKLHEESSKKKSHTPSKTQNSGKFHVNSSSLRASGGLKFASPQKGSPQKE